MIEYTFNIGGDHKTVQAEDLEEALKKVGIEEGDEYELISPGDEKDKYLLSSITDDILFGS